MTDAQWRKVVAEIVKELDYDQYKEIFVYPTDEDEDAKTRIDDLVNAGKKAVKEKAKK